MLVRLVSVVLLCLFFSGCAQFMEAVGDTVGWVTGSGGAVLEQILRTGSNLPGQIGLILGGAAVVVGTVRKFLRPKEKDFGVYERDSEGRLLHVPPETPIAITDPVLKTVTETEVTPS